MIIRRMMTGAHGGKTVYEVCNDSKELGGQVAAICRFKSLDTAAAVLRYLKGVKMTADDEQTAKQALQAIDEEEGK